MKFKKGDQIKITAGKDKGKTTKIEKISANKNLFSASGVNIFIKHQKAVGNEKGGRIEVVKPLAPGKFALICPKCNQITRVGFKANGGKIRICRKCGGEI